MASCLRGGDGATLQVYEPTLLESLPSCGHCTMGTFLFFY